MGCFRVRDGVADLPVCSMGTGFNQVASIQEGGYSHRGWCRRARSGRAAPPAKGRRRGAAVWYGGMMFRMHQVRSPVHRFRQPGLRSTCTASRLLLHPCRPKEYRRIPPPRQSYPIPKRTRRHSCAASLVRFGGPLDLPMDAVLLLCLLLGWSWSRGAASRARCQVSLSVAADGQPTHTHSPS